MFDRFIGRMHLEPFEVDDARRMEANRQYLIQQDPDAARILVTNVEDGHRTWKRNAQLTREIEQYSSVKHRQGEGHLFQRLFA
ncbi:hypothetical protein [Kitasatospora sp. NPDC127116]|uniref:hypothetical protein n=1 Tax=Kitasatospora sp. NPDC127116 TaxID=3345367 RepID=UPI0036333699